MLFMAVITSSYQQITKSGHRIIKLVKFLSQLHFKSSENKMALCCFINTNENQYTILGFFRSSFIILLGCY